MDKKQNSASKYVKVSDKKPNVSSGGKSAQQKRVISHARQEISKNIKNFKSLAKR